MGHTDTDPTRVGRDIVHPIGNGLAPIRIGKIIDIHDLRLPLGMPCSPAIAVAAHPLLFLGVHRDHRLSPLAKHTPDERSAETGHPGPEADGLPMSCDLPANYSAGQATVDGRSGSSRVVYFKNRRQYQQRRCLCHPIPNRRYTQLTKRPRLLLLNPYPTHRLRCIGPVLQIPRQFPKSSLHPFGFNGSDMFSIHPALAAVSTNHIPGFPENVFPPHLVHQRMKSTLGFSLRFRM